MEGAPSCSLTPEQTEGPFYFDADKIRSDIREGHDGAELRMRLQVRTAGECKPLRDAVVDIWHCDAAGEYSFDPDTFCRGAQATNADGIAEFTTVYPGWYQGRTVHIHAKVHLDNSTVLTTQLTFDDDFTAKVFEREPYAERSGRDTFNDERRDLRRGHRDEGDPGRRRLPGRHEPERRGDLGGGRRHDPGRRRRDRRSAAVAEVARPSRAAQPRSGAAAPPAASPARRSTSPAGPMAIASPTASSTVSPRRIGWSERSSAMSRVARAHEHPGHRVRVRHRERARAAGRLVAVLVLLHEASRPPPRSDTSTGSRPSPATPPCTAALPAAARRGCCAAPSPGWRRTSCPCARTPCRTRRRARSRDRRPRTGRCPCRRPRPPAREVSMNRGRGVDAEHLPLGPHHAGDPLSGVAEAAADVHHAVTGVRRVGSLSASSPCAPRPSTSTSRNSTKRSNRTPSHASMISSFDVTACGSPMAPCSRSAGG